MENGVKRKEINCGGLKKYLPQTNNGSDLRTSHFYCICLVNKRHDFADANSVVDRVGCCCRRIEEEEDDFPADLDHCCSGEDYIVAEKVCFRPGGIHLENVDSCGKHGFELNFVRRSRS